MPIGCIGEPSITSSSKSSKLSCCSLLVCSDVGEVDAATDAGVALVLPAVSEVWRVTAVDDVGGTLCRSTGVELAPLSTTKKSNMPSHYRYVLYNNNKDAKYKVTRLWRDFFTTAHLAQVTELRFCVPPDTRPGHFGDVLQTKSEKLNLTQQKQTYIHNKIYYNNTEKCNARLFCLLQPLAWKRNGPILKEVSKEVSK